MPISCWLPNDKAQSLQKSMKRKELKPVLIITYYWPPSAGAGVQRWLKFAKYLPEMGWRPIIFTPENPQFDLKDESLLQDIPAEVDVLKFPIWEPYNLFKFFNRTQKIRQGQLLEEAKNSWGKKLWIAIRGNLFIPDPRVFWVKPASNFLVDMVKTNGIQHVITTGPPHSMHLIGRRLKMKVPTLRWLVDFRDPWTEWDILHKMCIIPPIWKVHQRLEQNVLKMANQVVATGPSASEAFQKLGARKCTFLTNGYDAGDEVLTERDESFMVSHVGMLSTDRNPEVLWEQLNALAHSAIEFKLYLAGILSNDVLASIKEHKALKEVTEVDGYLAHAEVMQTYRKSHLLLLMQTRENNTQLPGKLFEYLQAKRPILCFGDPKSDVAEILRKTSSGKCFAYDDQEGIASFLKERYQDFKHNRQTFSFTGIEQYERKVLTQKLADLLDSMEN